jgi:glutamine synthetase type III
VQYEFAPLYGTVTTQIDQNLMVMQIIEEVSAQYGLAALMQVRPSVHTSIRPSVGGGCSVEGGSEAARERERRERG